MFAHHLSASGSLGWADAGAQVGSGAIDFAQRGRIPAIKHAFVVAKTATEMVLGKGLAFPENGVHAQEWAPETTWISQCLEVAQL